MAKNRNNLKARIRRGAGNPRPEIVTDSDVDYFIDEAIEEISRHAPAWTMSFVVSVKDTASYALALGIHDVCFCYYLPGVLSVGDIFGEGFEVLDEELLYNDVELVQYDKFVASLRLHSVQAYYDWEYNSFDQKLYLIPPPRESGDNIYYIGLKKWTFDTIPDRFEKYIHMYGVYRTLEQYGRTQRRETSVSHVGTTEPWSMAEEMLRDARRVKSDFDMYMQIEGKKMAVFLGD